MWVYWSFLMLSLFLLFFAQQKTREYISKKNAIVGYYTPQPLVLFSVAYVAFYASLRDVVLDTYAYIATFKNMPLDYHRMLLQIENTPGWGFHYLSGVFKIYISENHYFWLGMVACSSLYSLFRFYKTQSCNYALTFFLFIASTNFTWLLNGARQFLAVCILIGFCDLMFSKKKIYRWGYYVLMLIMTTIHSSVWFVIPITYICARGKLLDKWMFVVVLMAIIGTMNMQDVTEYASMMMNKDYSFDDTSGSSIMRLLISVVPITLVLLKLKEIHKSATPMLTFAINMSLVGACFFLAATFSSGILIGRMPIYFTLYNYILLPWLLKKFYPNKFIFLVCVFCYVFFFYFQMCIAWRGLGYGSDILGLKYVII